MKIVHVYKSMAPAIISNYSENYSADKGYDALKHILW
jgi:hypothetical protein